jgi:hypothetical protein
MSLSGTATLGISFSRFVVGEWSSDGSIPDFDAHTGEPAGTLVPFNIVVTNTLETGSPVPEPTTMLLFGIGLLGLAGVSRTRKQ